MKKSLTIILAIAFAAGFVGCGPSLESVILETTGSHDLIVGDSIQITVTTDPTVVDSVVLTGIGITLTDATDDGYSVFWKAEEPGTYQVTAVAWNGEESMESADSLTLEVYDGVLYYPVTQGYFWRYRIIERDTLYSFNDDTHETSESTRDSTSLCMGETTIYDGTEVWEFADHNDSLCYMSFDEEADKVYFYSDKTDTAEVTSWPYSLEVGTAWTVYKDDYTIDYEVIAAEDVSVTAGDYAECLKIEMSSVIGEFETYEGLIWLDKRFGTVKYWSKQTLNIPDNFFYEEETNTELTTFIEN